MSIFEASLHASATVLVNFPKLFCDWLHFMITWIEVFTLCWCHVPTTPFEMEVEVIIVNWKSERCIKQEMWGSIFNSAKTIAKLEDQSNLKVFSVYHKRDTTSIEIKGIIACHGYYLCHQLFWDDLAFQGYNCKLALAWACFAPAPGVWPTYLSTSGEWQERDRPSYILYSLSSLNRWKQSMLSKFVCQNYS